MTTNNHPGDNPPEPDVDPSTAAGVGALAKLARIAKGPSVRANAIVAIVLAVVVLFITKLGPIKDLGAPWQWAVLALPLLLAIVAIIVIGARTERKQTRTSDTHVHVNLPPSLSPSTEWKPSVVVKHGGVPVHSGGAAGPSLPEGNERHAETPPLLTTGTSEREDENVLCRRRILTYPQQSAEVIRNEMESMHDRLSEDLPKKANCEQELQCFCLFAVHGEKHAYGLLQLVAQENACFPRGTDGPHAQWRGPGNNPVWTAFATGKPQYEVWYRHQKPDGTYEETKTPRNRRKDICHRWLIAVPQCSCENDLASNVPGVFVYQGSGQGLTADDVKSHADKLLDHAILLSGRLAKASHWWYVIRREP
jgi:hypothetical protein